MAATGNIAGSIEALLRCLKKIKHTGPVDVVGCAPVLRSSTVRHMRALRMCARAVQHAGGNGRTHALHAAQAAPGRPSGLAAAAALQHVTLLQPRARSCMPQRRRGARLMWLNSLSCICPLVLCALGHTNPVSHSTYIPVRTPLLTATTRPHVALGCVPHADARSS